MQTTANRKADGPTPGVRENWGGKASEPVTPKTLLVNVITCGATPTVATLIVDPAASHNLIAWLEANKPGAILEVTNVIPYPGYMSPYGIKTDAYKATPASLFSTLAIPRPHKAFVRWLTERTEVSRTPSARQRLVEKIVSVCNPHTPRFVPVNSRRRAHMSGNYGLHLPTLAYTCTPPSPPLRTAITLLAGFWHVAPSHLGVHIALHALR
jgi:hypothetical protein